MKYRGRKATRNARKGAALLRYDPTRTTTIRNAFVAALKKRFSRLKLAMVNLLVRDDAFGLRDKNSDPSKVFNAFCPTGPGGGKDNSCGGQPSVAKTPKERVAEIEKVCKDFEKEHKGASTPKDLIHTRKVMGYFGTVDSFAINGLLRTGEVPGNWNGQPQGKYQSDETYQEWKDQSVTREAEVKATIETMRSEFDKTPIKTAGETVYRRVSSNVVENLKKGDTFSDKAFLSTTLSHSHGRGDPDRGQTSLVIKTPEGAPVLYYAKEAELVFQENTKLKITGITTEGKSKFVHAEMLPPKQQKGWVRNVEHYELDLDEGLDPEAPRRELVDNLLIANDRWRFESDPQKVKLFQAWLKSKVDQEFKTKSEQDLWAAYIRQGFEKGAGRSFDDVKSKRWGAGEGDFYAGSKREFLRDSFAQPIAQEKLELLAGRSYDGLENVTTAMSTSMSRSLTEGLVQGKSPVDIARDMEKDIDGIGKARALTIARTEIIAAHAEGQLMALEKLGVEEVGVAVEWSTAGDEKVCDECAPMEGVVLKLDEAKGMIPRHPNCRCAWIPANVGEDDEQKDSKRDIEGALRESLRAGGKQDEDGEQWGPGQDISKERPESILNMLRLSDFMANSGRWVTLEDGQHLFIKDGEVEASGPKTKAKKESPLSQAAIRKAIDEVESETLCGLGGKGKCAEASVALWDKLGKPKELVPYGVSLSKDTDTPGEDHVVLHNPKTGEIVDPTGYQYALPVFTSKGSSKFEGFKKLSDDSMNTYRKESLRLQRMEGKLSGEEYKQKLATLNAFCPTGEGGGVDATCSPAGAIPSAGAPPKKLALSDAKSNLARKEQQLEDLYEQSAYEDDEAKSEKMRLEGAALEAINAVLTNDIRARKDKELAAGSTFFYKTAMSGDVHAALHLERKGDTADIKWAGSLMKGEGDKLVEKALAFAKANGVSKVTATAKWGSEKYWQRKGFKIAGEHNPLSDSVPIELTMNAFCPTGLGGGVDPTCSPAGAIPGGGQTLRWGNTPRERGALTKEELAQQHKRIKERAELNKKEKAGTITPEEKTRLDQVKKEFADLDKVIKERLANKPPEEKKDEPAKPPEVKPEVKPPETKPETKPPVGFPDKVKNHADLVAVCEGMKEKWGYHGEVLTPDKPGYTFQVAGETYRAGGDCNLASGRITVFNNTAFRYGGMNVEGTKGLMAHEMMHGTYERVHQWYRDEQYQISNSPIVDQIIRADGSLKPGWEQTYPTYNRMHKFENADPKQMAADDGVSAYSRQYWKGYAEGKVQYHIAVHETLSEIARLQEHDSLWHKTGDEHPGKGKLAGSETFRAMYTTVRDEYDYKQKNQPTRKNRDYLTGNAEGFGDYHVFINDDFEPVKQADATLLIFWRKDGTSGFAIPVKE